jgi:hypothetical protein
MEFRQPRVAIGVQISSSGFFTVGPTVAHFAAIVSKSENRESSPSPVRALMLLAKIASIEQSMNTLLGRPTQLVDH